MAQLKFFSIRDNKVSAYLRPFVDQNEIMAVRGLTAAVNMPKDSSQVAQFPEDFDLYHVATMDDITGEVIPEQPPKFIISAINCVKKGNENAVS